MGFDIYGINPNNPNNAIKPEQMDWSKKPSDEERDKYFSAINDYEEQVVGSYFCNNVWWWRPLWAFVCNNCDDFLTENDMNKGGSNSGEKISKTKATKIGKRLSQKLADGTVDEVYRSYELAAAKAKVHNDIIKKEMDKISKECREKHGEDLVPANYPEPYKTQWNDAFYDKSWDDSYPFNKDNVESFAKFCLESGGFEIC